MWRDGKLHLRWAGGEPVGPAFHYQFEEEQAKLDAVARARTVQEFRAALEAVRASGLTAADYVRLVHTRVSDTDPGPFIALAVPNDDLDREVWLHIRGRQIKSLPANLTGV